MAQIPNMHCLNEETMGFLALFSGFPTDIISKSPKKLKRFQFLYVRHDFCIDNPQRVGGTHYCYSHLNNDFSKAVSIRDHVL